MKHSQLKKLIKEEIESFIKRSELDSVKADRAIDVMDEYDVLPDQAYYDIAKELGTNVQNLKYVSYSREDYADGFADTEEYDKVLDAHNSNKSSLVDKKIGNAIFQINKNIGTAAFVTNSQRGGHRGFLFVA